MPMMIGSSEKFRADAPDGAPSDGVMSRFSLHYTRQRATVVSADEIQKSFCTTTTDQLKPVKFASDSFGECQ